MEAANPDTLKKYRACLIKCWNYSRETAYPTTHTLSDEELSTLTPEEIYAFMAQKVFGMPNPVSGQDLPTVGRSSSIEFDKKAISYFMPNKWPWDEQEKKGNPTRSAKVNKLIANVKKAEVSKQGKNQTLFVSLK